MTNPKSSSTSRRFAAALGISILLCGIGPVISRPLYGTPIASAAIEGPAELEETLFVLNPHLKNPKGVETPGVLLVVSVPQPILKYCMGKTSEQCAAIDYCIRTTTKTVAMCQKLPPNLRNLPPYPAGMAPNRMFSISFFQGAPNIKGFDALRQYYDHAPKGSLDLFSPHARFKGKIRFTKTPTDGQFALLEVLSVPDQ